MLVLCARTVLGAAGGCIPMNKIGGDVWPCGACVVSFDFHLYLERDFSVGHVDHGPFLWSDCVCLLSSLFRYLALMQTWKCFVVVSLA